jgi:hypothetical protein
MLQMQVVAIDRCFEYGRTSASQDPHTLFRPESLQSQTEEEMSDKVFKNILPDYGEYYDVESLDMLPTPTDGLCHTAFVRNSLEGYIWIEKEKKWVLMHTNSAVLPLNTENAQLKLRIEKLEAVLGMISIESDPLGPNPADRLNEMRTLAREALKDGK